VQSVLSKPVDLKNLERQAYLAYHGDGIIDLFIGFVLIWAAILLAIIPDMSIFLVGSFVVLLPLYASAKKSFTVPRMGYVEFSASRQRNAMFLLLIINGLLVVGVFLGFATWLVPPVTNFLITYYLIVIGTALAAIFCLAGYVTDINRFYGYGLVVFIGFVLTHLFNLSFALPLIAVSIVMIINGSILLYRFTKQYPKVENQPDWQENDQGA
jgi:hypothetical protein